MGGCTGIEAKYVPVLVNTKDLSMAGDVLIGDLWKLSMEDRMYIHKADCQSSRLLKVLTARPNLGEDCEITVWGPGMAILSRMWTGCHNSLR